MLQECQPIGCASSGMVTFFLSEGGGEGGWAGRWWKRCPVHYEHGRSHWIIWFGCLKRLNNVCQINVTYSARSLGGKEKPDFIHIYRSLNVLSSLCSLIWDFLLFQINIWTTTTWSNVWVVLPKPSWYEFLIEFLIWTPASKYLNLTKFSNICVILSMFLNL